jgi:hypothetical protein
MISAGNEGIPPKEDTTSVNKSQSTIAINLVGTENPEATKSTTSTSTGTTTNSQGMFRTQFEQKTKILRDAWAQHDFKIPKDSCQLFSIILLSIFGIACNIAAISSDRWTCDTQLSFGLWNTCYQPITDGPLWDIYNKNSTNSNESAIATPLQPVKCAKQGVRWVEIDLAQPQRIEQVYAAQGLLVCGCILYIFSLFTICLSYRFVKTSNLISLRNTLIGSVCIQFFAFFLMLIGFYLFILTGQYSVSVGLLFVYFGLAMFASNTINFITVEYKAHKNQICASSCQ